MRQTIAIAGTLIALIIILGCTQQTPSITTSCIDYCDTLTHQECQGYWNVTGTYPDCFCEWKCNNENIVTSTGCIINWTCSDWSECKANGKQNRTCTDLNNCNTTQGKPETSQDCTFVNPCGSISDTRLISECSAMLYENPALCSNDNYTNLCIDEVAQVTFNTTICDLINDSIIRNTCKAKITNDKSYCNILTPANRQECYNKMDEFLNYRASIEADTSYCSLIINTTLYNNCSLPILANKSLNYLNDYARCNQYIYTPVSGYQEVYSCYEYNMKRLNDTTPCDYFRNTQGLNESFYNECKAVYNNNISYCYDFTGLRRDRCYASFAYYRNDTLTCRDADDAYNCKYTVCYYYGNINFCTELSENLRNVLIYDLATKCTLTSWKPCHKDYCELLTDNELKNSCIYYTIKQEKLTERKLKNYI